MYPKNILAIVLVILMQAAICSSTLDDDNELESLLEELEDNNLEARPPLDTEIFRDEFMTGTATENADRNETPLDKEVDAVDHMEEARKQSETSVQGTAEDMIDHDYYQEKEARSFEPDRYEIVGCYLDKGGENRPLPVLVDNLRPYINSAWSNLNRIIHVCANLAEFKGYTYFGIQYWGECWSGPKADQTFDKDGPSQNCAFKFGVGKAGSNLVYRFKSKTTTAPPPTPTTLSGECAVYKVLDSADRSSNQGPLVSGKYKCDIGLNPGWYRFTGEAGNQMSTTCVPKLHCSTHAPGWIEGKLPSVAEESVERKVCFSWGGKCCYWKQSIMVRNCDGYFVYKLEKPPQCKLRYCGNGRAEMTTSKPTTAKPTTDAPTTVAPTTVAPTTVAPTTVAPTTVAPTTVAPTTAKPTAKPRIRSFILCEHHSGVLRCPSGKQVKIRYANYGRTTRLYRCPHWSIRTTKCLSRTAANLIRCACNGRNSCPLFAKNEVYGDPCAGTYKYIEVKYQCI